MTRSRLVFAIAASITLCACSSLREDVGGWFGTTPETPARPATAEQGQTYYAAVDGLTVLAEPSASSKAVGRLALHERVTRTRVERGYAYIAAQRGGLEGWVDNAHLIWRLPAEGVGPTPIGTEIDKETGQAPGAAGAAGAGAATDAETAPTAAPTTSVPATAPAEATATSLPATPAAQPTPTTRTKPAPSMFDPY